MSDRSETTPYVLHHALINTDIAYIILSETVSIKYNLKGKPKHHEKAGLKMQQLDGSTERPTYIQSKICTVLGLNESNLKTPCNSTGFLQKRQHTY